MKLLAVPLLLAVSCAATPLNAFAEAGLAAQSILSDFNKFDHAISNVRSQTASWIDKGRRFIQQDGVTYEKVTFVEYPNYELRVRSPQLCDPDVLQYSGYLDVKDGSHSLFFWFFESRSKPSEDPLILWLNGGPGCSSTTGLLFELGPCTVKENGQNTTINRFSWNTEANIIFLDQPVNVGYSYGDGSSVSTSPVAAIDVWSFLSLFLRRYPKYSDAHFHLAAESYGGHFAPNIASVIHRKNKELLLAPVPGQPVINLASVVLANGLTDPYTQFGKVADYACEGPYPVFDSNGSECRSLRNKTPTCQRLVAGCYKSSSRLACVPAGLYCWSQLYGSFQQMGLNPYDVRRACDRRKDGSLCYKEMEWIEAFMNTPSVKEQLGARSNLRFQSCNLQVNQAFMTQGDGMHNSAILLPELLADGVRLLVYAGNADFMCNYMGNEAWMEALESEFKSEFLQAGSEPMVLTSSGKSVGRVRSAGGDGETAGNYTFVEVFDAGHMVPFDQPEAARDMIIRWLRNTPLSS